MPRELPHGRAHFNKVFRSYYDNARRRGIPFLISAEEFEEIALQDCYYCGAKPIERGGSRLKTRIALNGLDRINNDLGYIASNCVASCPRCNYLKREMSLAELLEVIAKIYNLHFVGS